MYSPSTHSLTINVEFPLSNCKNMHITHTHTHNECSDQSVAPTQTLNKADEADPAPAHWRHLHAVPVPIIPNSLAD